MTKKPHLQAEMLKAIADDASLLDKLQSYDYRYEEYRSCYPSELLTLPHKTYRFKPREFKEGWWYPMVFSDGRKSFYVFIEKRFCVNTMASSISFSEEELIEHGLKCIGKGFQPDFGDGDEINIM